MIPPARFFRHVAHLDDSEDTCWVWVGACTDDGRGILKVDGKHVSAHRVAWQIIHGEPPPADRRLSHVCSHPQCVRHWQVGDYIRKLTPDERRTIGRSLLPIKVLARKYGVSPPIVRRCRLAMFPGYA